MQYVMCASYVCRTRCEGEMSRAHRNSDLSIHIRTYVALRIEETVLIDLHCTECMPVTWSHFHYDSSVTAYQPMICAVPH